MNNKYLHRMENNQIKIIYTLVYSFRAWDFVETELANQNIVEIK